MKKGYKMTEAHRLAIKAGVARARALDMAVEAEPMAQRVKAVQAYMANSEQKHLNTMTITSNGFVFSLEQARSVWADLGEIFSHE